MERCERAPVSEEKLTHHGCSFSDLSISFILEMNVCNHVFLRSIQACNALGITILFHVCLCVCVGGRVVFRVAGGGRGVAGGWLYLVKRSTASFRPVGAKNECSLQSLTA